MSHIYLKAKAKLYWYYATLFGKVPFRDNFGLRYYLWRNTRLHSGVIGGVRTDDTGVLVQLFAILESLVERRAKSEEQRAMRRKRSLKRLSILSRVRRRRKRKKQRTKSYA